MLIESVKEIVKIHCDFPCEKNSLRKKYFWRIQHRYCQCTYGQVVIFHSTPARCLRIDKKKIKDTVKLYRILWSTMEYNGSATEFKAVKFILAISDEIWQLKHKRPTLTQKQINILTDTVNRIPKEKRLVDLGHMFETLLARNIILICSLLIC